MSQTAKLSNPDLHPLLISSRFWLNSEQFFFGEGPHEPPQVSGLNSSAQELVAVLGGVAQIEAHPQALASMECVAQGVMTIGERGNDKWRLPLCGHPRFTVEWTDRKVTKAVRCDRWNLRAAEFGARHPTTDDVFLNADQSASNWPVVLSPASTYVINLDINLPKNVTGEVRGRLFLFLARRWILRD